MVALEQVLWCCQGCPRPSVCILLWLSRLSVCDQLQASRHGASPSVPSIPTLTSYAGTGCLWGCAVPGALGRARFEMLCPPGIVSACCY